MEKCYYHHKRKGSTQTVFQKKQIKHSKVQMARGGLNMIFIQSLCFRDFH